jgi:hypothetical protein
VAALLVVRADAVEFTQLEGAARGYPVLRDASGKKLADGHFAQWTAGPRLHVQIVYQFGGGHRIEERTVLRQRPELVQEQWSWEERRNGAVSRRFDVNFATGKATAQKRNEDGVKHWEEEIDVEPGRTFAGFGFTLAVKGLNGRLVRGERIQLQAIGFTPQPRSVTVEISHAGLDQLPMAGRLLRADHFIVHPKLPWIADLFTDVPDAHIWLSNPAPAGFVRWEGPTAEPEDPIVRVDVLPGGISGPARRLDREQK